MRARRPIALAAGLATATVLALTGCSDSGSDSASEPSSATSASSGTSTDTGAGAATPETEDTSGDDLTADTFIKTVAAAQGDAKAYTFTMKMSANGSEVSDAKGAVVNTGGKPAVAMTMDVGGQKIDARYVDDVWYMNLGDASENKFVKIDPKTDGSEMAQQFEQLSAQMDPSESIKAIDGAVTSVTKKGDPVTLDGVEAQPYEVVVDTTKITGTMGDTLKAAGASVPDELTYTYWVGPDHLMRKMTFEMAGTSTEMTTSDWNGDVKVEAPSKDEITDKSPFTTGG